MMKNFLKCGVMGWCLEILWTGFQGLCHHDKKAMGSSSIFMFPIYGMAALIKPLYRLIRKWKPFFRGEIYMCGIYLAEYLTGSALRKWGRCPWDYSKAKHNIRGLIRLDYAPLWFATGLLYEKLLTSSEKVGHKVQSGSHGLHQKI